MSPESASPQPDYNATCEEKYLHGLMCGSKKSRNNIEVAFIEGRGRSAFAKADFYPGDFVCEYSSVVREKQDDDDWGDQRNAELGIGCYCLDAIYNGKVYTFDAAPKIHHPGRFINHARHNPNLLLKKPVWIGTLQNGRLRIGLVAKRKILKGQELFFDYGIKDKDLPWLETDAKKICVTINEGMCIYI